MFSGRTCLARVGQQQGNKEDAEQMLVKIHNWFTQGFDTKALQQLRALLEALS